VNLAWMTPSADELMTPLRDTRFEWKYVLIGIYSLKRQYFSITYFFWPASTVNIKTGLLQKLWKEIWIPQIELHTNSPLRHVIAATGMIR